MATIRHRNTHRVAHLPLRTLDDIVRQHGAETSATDSGAAGGRYAPASRQLIFTNLIEDMRHDLPAVLFAGFVLGCLATCVAALVWGAVL
jgi:dethiobiotin synthetase